MSDPTTTTTTSTATSPGWFTRIRTDVAGAVHDFADLIDPAVKVVETDVAKVVKAEIPAAATFALNYLERNRAEFANKVASAIVGAVLAKVPGLDIAAPELTPLIVTEFDTMVGVLEGEIKTLAKPNTGA